MDVEDANNIDDFIFSVGFKTFAEVTISTIHLTWQNIWQARLAHTVTISLCLIQEITYDYWEEWTRQEK